jgi:UDP-glucose 4-epimerase
MYKNHLKQEALSMKILLTGGAGYIGSHTAVELLNAGYDVVIADSLEAGHKKAVPAGVKLFVGDIRDRAFLDKVLTDGTIDAVVHFAAYSLVPESMADPLKYYDNNVGGTRSLLSAMTAHGVLKIVFSSSAAVYGEPVHIPIVETDPTSPTNAYGATKLAMEQMLHWSDVACGAKSVALRYFNACGALADGSIGEDHKPETHLIPLVLQTACGLRPHLSLFGRDYDTKDGTCVRDYVHVSDLASAHVLAVKHLAEGGESDAVNLGNGVGFSNLEIIEAAGAVVGHKIPAVDAPRRAGDPATLVASSQKAKKLLGWSPRYTDIGSIIETAWKWHNAHPKGFDDR